MKMRNNWNATFKDANDGTFFLAGGYLNPMVTVVTKPETFLGKALVDLEEANAMNASSLSDVWTKVVVDAPEFGISNHVFERKDIPAATLKWAKDTAENNRDSGPRFELM